MPVSYLLNIDQIHQNSRYREVTLENARVPYLQTISLLHIDVLSNYFEAIGVLLIFGPLFRRDIKSRGTRSSLVVYTEKYIDLLECP